MGQKKYPFDAVLNKTAAAGSNDLATEPVAPRRLYCVQRVAAENETTAYTNLKLLKAGTGGEIPLEEFDNPQAGKLYWTSDQIYLTEGQYLVARLAGCTASDVLRAFVSGYWRETEESTRA